MKNLEDIIGQNKELFNSEEPSEGHFERFQHKLQKNSKQSLVSLRFLLRAAVIAIFLTFSGLWVYKHTFLAGDPASAISLSDISQEYKEAEMYFTSQIDDKYFEIEQLKFFNSEEKDMVLEELEEMDVFYKKLQEDLQANPNDERVINAMITHYQIKLKIMNRILNELYKVKSQKPNTYETTDI